MRFWLLVALALCACKQSTRATDEVASCNAVKAGNCREYGKANLAAGTENLEKLCALSRTATFSATPCPTTNAIGRCALKEHTDVYYASYPIPAEELAKACRMAGGTFSAR